MSREIKKRWPLDPKLHGSIPHVQPVGIRTPNNEIWGHDLGDFYDVRPMSGINESRSPIYWSLSMIRAFVQASEVTSLPKLTQYHDWKTRLKRPWSLLQLPCGHNYEKDTGREDEGCEHCLNQFNPSFENSKDHADVNSHIKSDNELRQAVRESKIRNATCVCNCCKEPGTRRPRPPKACAKHHPEALCESKELEDKQRNEMRLIFCETLCATNSNPILISPRWLKLISPSPIDDFLYGSRSTKRAYSPENFLQKLLPAKVEEYVPEALLPDILLVVDHYGVLSKRQGLEAKMRIRYRRVVSIVEDEGDRSSLTVFLDCFDNIEQRRKAPKVLLVDD